MPPKKTAPKKRTMSDQHKAAIAEGRVQSKAVKGYLEALATTKRKRGRQRTPETIAQRLRTIDAELSDADELTALNLRQEKRNLQAELTTKQTTVDVSTYEADFVAHARAYGKRKGISYKVWRDSGVPVDILKRAGIARSA